MNQISTASTSTPFPEKWVRALLDKMLMQYGKKFTEQWGAINPDKMAAHWGQELAGYSGPEVGRGVVAMESRDWPPTVPEFKRLCRPPVDTLAAYHEATAGLMARARGEHGSWSHPAVYWAATLLSRDLMGQTYGQVKDRWASVLSGQMANTEWVVIPPPRLQIEAPGKGELSKENATRMLQQLNASGIFKTSKDGVDSLRWARRILERVVGGDKSLSIAAINSAKEALGLHDRCSAQ